MHHPSEIARRMGRETSAGFAPHGMKTAWPYVTGERVDQFPIVDSLKAAMGGDPARKPDMFDLFDLIPSSSPRAIHPVECAETDMVHERWSERDAMLNPSRSVMYPRPSVPSEMEEAHEIASKMYLAKRSPLPYKTFIIDGFSYAVENSGSESDYQAAKSLHHLNTFAIRLITSIGQFIEAVEDGDPDALEFLSILQQDGLVWSIEDEDPLWMVEVMHERLRSRYTVDSVYEATGADGGTSFVINLGEEVHMCVRSEDHTDQKAVLYTVMTHELSHVASTTPYHDEEFWNNYSILARFVGRMGVLQRSDVPLDGATHCERIRIDRSEMLNIASGYEARNSLPIVQRPLRLSVGSTSTRTMGKISTQSPDSVWSSAEESRSTYMPHLKFEIRETALGTSGHLSPDIGEEDGWSQPAIWGTNLSEPSSEKTYPREAAVLVNPFYVANRSPFSPWMDWRSGLSSEGRRTPRESQVYVPPSPIRSQFSIYTRSPYVMGRTNVSRGESLHHTVVHSAF